MKISLFILILLVLCGSLAVKAHGAAKPLQLEEGEHRYHITGDYLIDKSTQLSLKDLIDRSNHPDFITSDLSALNFGFQRSPVWLRFSIHNPLAKRQFLFISINYGLLNHVEFYSPDNTNHYQKIISGIDYPSKFRTIDNKYFVYPVNVEPNTTQTYYLKIISTYNFSTPITVSTPLAFIDYLSWEHLLFGCYFGLIIAMILYNSFLFFTIKDPVYLHYVGLIFFSGSVQLGMSGIIFPYIQETTFWNSKHFYFSGAMTIIFLIQFCRSFLQTRKNIPIFDIVLRGIITIDLVLLFLLFTYETYSYLPIVLLALFSVFCQIYAGISAFIRGYSPARYYLLASSMYAIGGLFICLYGLALIDATTLARLSFLIGSSLEAILLSFALADRINHLKKEKASSIIAEKKAQWQTKTKSEFLAKMSHEIRTPMTGLIGISDILMQTELQPQQRYYLEIVNHSGKGLLKTINNILDYAKLEIGKIELEISTVNIDQFINEIANEYGPLTQFKPIKFIAYTDPKMPNLVEVDSLRLGQTIKHLLDNAFKFTQKGEIILEAGVTQSDGEDSLQFTLQDSGLGIEQINTASLFESFNQAESGDARKFGGTGLGLTIAKELIELMHGGITLENNINKGTTCWIHIPLLINKSLISSTKNNQLKTLKIKNALVFTNHLHLKKMFDIQLASFGFNCKTLPLASKIEEYEITDLNSHVIFIDYDHHDSSSAIVLLKEFQKLAINSYNQILLLPNGETLASLNLLNFKDIHQLEKPITSYKLKQLTTNFSQEEIYSDHTDQSQRLHNQNKFILIVEDNPINQLLIQNLLKKLQIQYMTASNGQEAVNALKIQQQKFNAVLMDCEMPIMNGFEATTEIRKLKDLKDLPIIGLTAHYEQEIKKQCLAAGMNDVLTKPINYKTLTKILVSLT